MMIESSRPILFERQRAHTSPRNPISPVGSKACKSQEVRTKLQVVGSCKTVFMPWMQIGCGGNYASCNFWQSKDSRDRRKKRDRLSVRQGANCRQRRVERKFNKRHARACWIHRCYLHY